MVSRYEILCDKSARLNETAAAVICDEFVSKVANLCTERGFGVHEERPYICLQGFADMGRTKFGRKGGL